MKTFLAACLLFVAANCLAQKTDTLFLKTDGATLHVVVTHPKKSAGKTALFIAGSGPTDLNGNNPMMSNNSLLFLSNALVKKGITTVRFDKRGIGKSTTVSSREEDQNIDNMVNDVKELLHLCDSLKLEPVTVIGHSEGSLIGLIALQQQPTTRFISLAGIAQSADTILKQQLQPQLPKEMYAQLSASLDTLKSGLTLNDPPKALYSLLRPSVQPYMISWFRYTPSELIQQLTGPVLIVQGTTDIQVSVSEAQRLHNALPSSTLVLIEGMNHVLKQAPIDRSKNIATYSQPKLPIDKTLSATIIQFILNK